MIDWLYQSTTDISVIIVLVLLIRNPVRRILGANISYWLWSLPALRLIFSDSFERPAVITKYLSVPETSDIITVYTSPIQASHTQIEIIGLIWLLGLVVWSVIKIIQTVKFKSLLKKHSHSTDLKGTIPDALWKKLNKKTQIKVSSAVSGPLISGLFKPTIYLPEQFHNNYNLSQRQLILQHELNHAMRFDLWTQFLAEIIRAIMWFNPMVHIAWNKFQQDQELACDYQVLKNTDSQTRQTYGETLKIGLSALLTPNSLHFFNHKHERFIMLTKHKTNPFTFISGFALILALGFMMLTKTGVSLAEKTEAKNGTLISFNFIQIPLVQVVELIALTTEQEEILLNLELLEGIKINTEVENVHAFDYFDEMLKNNNLKVDRQEDTWSFSKL